MNDTITYPPCKGKNCGSTDGWNHSKECLQEHADCIDGVAGSCSVPMWINGCPAGTCGERSWGKRPPSPMWFNYATRQEMREDGRYAGYVPGLACPVHGGPKGPKL